MSTCKCGAPSLSRAECVDAVLGIAERVQAGDDATTLRLQLASVALLVLGRCLECVFPAASKEAA